MIKSKIKSIALNIYVQSKAAKTEFVGVYGDTLKFRVAVPLIAGEANAELCCHVAKLFSIPRRMVSVCSGQGSRKKRIEVSGINEKSLMYLESTAINLASKVWFTILL